MNKAALILIHNHQYNENIDTLEKIYKNRFSDIFHLVPFYTGMKDNVIPVYENSFYFQGYVAQGLHGFFDEKYSHYFFIADDLMLNPEINEDNYADIFRLDEDTSFVSRLTTFYEQIGWDWDRSVSGWNIKVNGIEADNQLPDHQRAIDKFTKFGLTVIEPPNFKQIWSIRHRLLKYLCNRNFKNRFISFYRYLINSKKGFSYPLARSYSDIFIVNAKCIKEFCHYCGVFAATRLFVEVAVPTSIILSSDNIMTEKDLNLRGKALWGKKDFQELEKYKNSLTDLMNDFPPGYLYLHPIKLTKWKTGQ